MDSNDQISVKQTDLTRSSKDFTPTRARSFKVKARQHNYAQYVRTVRAYALAGLPFEHIANAGDFLQDEVEREETDAPIHEGWQEKLGEVAENEGNIMAWQNRGEVVSLNYQIESPTSITGMEVVAVSGELTTVNIPQEKTIDVIEGIAVFNDLENNPYLKAPPLDYKK